ncbi:MAG: glycosyltransferase [Deltaproteobacteria bacterium]|nr:glycosyltransferase [Deltaproteobacteria bacterium]MBW2301453.1 glycosyltransferase [Deltaproteobacteria bacterium]
MHIAMMSAWNTDSGVAVHAEPLGKAWKNQGHDVTIFTHVKEDFHGDGFTGQDQDYVTRCFGTQKTNFLDPRPILSSNFDVLVVQDLRMLPVENLAKIFPLIKCRARTVHVVHENKLPEEPWFYQFDWDGVVYFDPRQGFLNDVYPHAKLIPFPCFPARSGDKVEARKKLGLPLDKHIVYVFCHRGYEPFLRDLRDDLKEDTILLFVIPRDYQMVEKEDPPPWMIIREEETLTEERFDDYLFAADCVILHKFQTLYLGVVSSTAFQALGAGCPIFVPEGSDYFRPLGDELLHYGDVSELNDMLVKLFQDGEMRKNVLDAANGFVAMNSPEIIAKLFIDFFVELGRPS